MYSMLRKKQLLSQNEMSQNVPPRPGLSQEEYVCLTIYVMSFNLCLVWLTFIGSRTLHRRYEQDHLDKERIIFQIISIVSSNQKCLTLILQLTYIWVSMFPQWIVML